MTVVESRAPAAQASPSPASTAAAAPGAPGAAGAATLSRNPEVRLGTLFDDGSLRLLTPHDTSGAVAATGTALAQAIAQAPQRRGRHGNIPL